MKQAILISVLALIFSSNAYAGPKSHGKSRGLDQFAQKLFYHLDLNAEQKSEIKAIAAQFKADRKAQREAMKSVDKTQFKALMDNSTFDEAAARALIEEKQSKHLDMSLNRLKAKHQILNVLTDDQRSQLETIRATMKKAKRADIN